MRLFRLKKAVPANPAANPRALPKRSCHEHSCHENIPYEECLAEQIRGRLLDLGFPAFALCLCRLLQALGYQDVHLAGRREWKGYNKPGGGGYDLEATLPGSLLPGSLLPGSLLPGSLSPRRVIAQIKQFDGLHVHQRNVDELRGTCLRVGAAEALLITTSAFSKVVRAETAAPNSAGSSIAPVRLMDGDELIALLIHHRLGVKGCKVKGRKTFTAEKLTNRKLVDEKSGDKLWEIDDTFFAELALASAILSKELPAKRQDHAKPQNPVPTQGTTPMQNLMQWRVTVRISSNSTGDNQKKRNSQEGNSGQKGGG